MSFADDITTCANFIEGRAFVIRKDELRDDYHAAQFFKPRDHWYQWENGIWSWAPSHDAKWWVDQWHFWAPGVNDPYHLQRNFIDVLRFHLSVPLSLFKNDPCWPGSVITIGPSSLEWRTNRVFAFEHCEGYRRDARGKYPSSEMLHAWVAALVVADERGGASDVDLALSLASYCTACGHRAPMEWARTVAVPWAMTGISRSTDGTKWRARVLPLSECFA
jgi:hypothetical protein